MNFALWVWTLLHVGLVHGASKVYLFVGNCVTSVKGAWCQKGFGKRSMRAQQLPRIPRKNTFNHYQRFWNVTLALNKLVFSEELSLWI